MGFWPSTFVVYMTRKPSTLRDCQAWVKRYSPPICTFMPDRVQDPNANAFNQKNFSSFSRVLLQNQMVSIEVMTGPCDTKCTPIYYRLHLRHGMRATDFLALELSFILLQIRATCSLAPYYFLPRSQTLSLHRSPHLYPKNKWNTLNNHIWDLTRHMP